MISKCAYGPILASISQNKKTARCNGSIYKGRMRVSVDSSKASVQVFGVDSAACLSSLLVLSLIGSMPN